VSAGETAPPPRFAGLIGTPPGSLDAAQALAGWREQTRSEGVALNMIASVDGRIAVGGRSAPLGSPADRALFHALRARADAVMAGAGTIRTERYRPIIRDGAVVEQRRREGLTSQPLAVIVSRSLEIDATVPLLADPASHIVVLTPSAGEIAAAAATVDYVRSATLREGLVALRERFGVGPIVCEGGPSLNGALAAESLIDEIFLALAPLLVGDVPGGRAVVTGGAPPAPERLELRMLLEASEHLFARYVAAG
jgi:riboflavin biosynthesis pyrimidine reductase